MPYATHADVEARAGRARTMFEVNDAPSTSEITQFIVDVGEELDAHLAAAGVALPVSDTTALGALKSVVADGATWLALAGCINSDASEKAVNRPMSEAKARYLSALKDIDKGQHSVLGLLVTAAEGGVGAASDFWTENPTYDLTAVTERLTRSPSVVPPFRKGMGL